MERIDCLVIGAGVVGLAVARALAMAGRDVVIVDRADRIGAETSSRNSEVIHAGIYYNRSSLMARFCVEGRRALYDYCSVRGVPHARCGKLIVATSKEETAQLAAIKAMAEANGVVDLAEIGAPAAREMEPALQCEGALLSPSTGIIDSHAYMLALLADAEAHGAILALNTPVMAGKVLDDGFELAFGGAEPAKAALRALHQCGGSLRARPGPRNRWFSDRTGATAYYAKGNYFALAGRSPFRRLIYPSPFPAASGPI